MVGDGNTDIISSILNDFFEMMNFYVIISN